MKPAAGFLLVLALILPAPGFRLAAQTTAHQRLGVPAREALEITVGTSLELISSDATEGGAVEIDPSMSLDFLIMQRFGLSFEVPAVARFALSRDAAPKAVLALGDPSVEATYSFRSSDWRFGAGLSYTHPLGIWDSYESAEKRITSGTGYPRLGATLSALRYLDPLVAGVKLGAETCLARTERFGSATKPLILGASLFATEALNFAAALSAGLTSRLAWPRRLEGSVGGSSMTWSLSGSASLLFSEGGRTLRFGVSKMLSDYAAPVGLDIGCSYTFKGKE